MKKLLLTMSCIAFAVLCFGQLTNHETTQQTQKIKPNLFSPGTELSLDLINGVSMPRGDFGNIAKDGFNSGFVINKKYCKSLSVGLGANYSAFRFRQDFGQVQSGGSQYQSTSLDIGPQYTLSMGRFSLKFFGRSGLSFINTPTIMAYYPNSEFVTTSFQKQNTTALITRLGTDLSAKLCSGLQIFLSTEYVRALNNDFDYQTRDLTDAVRADGTIDPNLANEISFTNESFNFSGLNINFGININIGSSSNKVSTRNTTPVFTPNNKQGDNPLFKSQTGIKEGYQFGSYRAKDYKFTVSDSTTRSVVHTRDYYPIDSTQNK